MTTKHSSSSADESNPEVGFLTRSPVSSEYINTGTLQTKKQLIAGSSYPLIRRNQGPMTQKQKPSTMHGLKVSTNERVARLFPQAPSNIPRAHPTRLIHMICNHARRSNFYTHERKPRHALTSVPGGLDHQIHVFDSNLGERAVFPTV